MKKTTLLLLLPVLVITAAFGQSTDEHLKLLTEYPAAGQKITLTYDSVGTVLDNNNKTHITGIVYYLDNKDFPAADIVFKPEGKQLTSSIDVPADTKAFFIKVNRGQTQIDNNNEKGYVYMVYRDKKPVPGAYAMTAYMLSSGMGTDLAKIKTNKVEAVSLYQQEFKLHPESRKDYGYNYAAQVVMSTDGMMQAHVNEELNWLINSGEEKNMRLAASYYIRQKKTASADSLNAIIKTKFPESTAKNQMLTDYYKEKDVAVKEQLLSAYFKKYPSEPAKTKEIMYAQLAYGYLLADKPEDYTRIAALVGDKTLLTAYQNSYADKKGRARQNLEFAALLAKQAIDVVEEEMKQPKGAPYQAPSAAAKALRDERGALYDTYAVILFAQNKFKEAIQYEDLPYRRSPGRTPIINENYALMLNADGQYDKAKEVVELSIRNGKSTGKVDSICKLLYLREKKSEEGYGTYYAMLRSVADQAMKVALAKEMIKQPAPLFALKDLDGKTISLADLKGKVVIVDFWATWCGPCKASFPGMQLAVTRFKNDPNVKFVFVDTRETDDNYIAGVKKFIADNKYTFHVLLDDEMNAEKHRGKIIDDYKVTGIPTKFIIDGNGDIRFTKVGFTGSAENLADEVSAMVNLAQHPDQAKVAVDMQVK